MKPVFLKEALMKMNKGQLDLVYLVMGDDYFLQEYFIKRCVDAHGENEQIFE